jgi:hypothetical protein
MKISIDGKTDVLSSDNGNSLADILCRIEILLAQRGRRISRGRVDGAPLKAEDKGLLKKKVEDFNLLEIETVEVRSQVLKALSEVKAHLPTMVEEVTNVTQQIQSGNLVQGYRALGDCADMLGVMIRVVEEVRLLTGISLDSLKLPGESMVQRLNGFRDILKSTKDALDAHDTVTVADLMEYELAPALEKWSEVLDGLIKKVSE